MICKVIRTGNSFEFLFGTPKRGRGKDPLPTPTHTQRQERNALTALPCRRRGSDQIYLRKQKAWFQLPAPAEGTTPNLVCLNNSLFYPHRFHEAGTWTETAGLCPMASGPQLLGRRAGQRGRNLPTLRRSPVWALGDSAGHGVLPGLLTTAPACGLSVWLGLLSRSHAVASQGQTSPENQRRLPHLSDPDS